MNPGPRIYNLFPLLAGPMPRWAPHLERAAAMGFTWIFVNAFHAAGYSGSLYSIRDYYAIDPRLLDAGSEPMDQLRDMLNTASGLGLRVMMDLVINHTAFDSPLLREHPSWFRRDADGRVVHPGAKDGKRRVVWRDLAEVDNAGSPDRAALWTYWSQLAVYYARLGVSGFRCDAAYLVPPPLWQELIAVVKAEYPGTLFFAETLGCTPEQTLATAATGFDFIFNSSKWWDFRAPWCPEQYALTAPVVPSVSFPESHDTPRLAAELDDRAAVLQRYAFAALFSTGVLMPIGFEYGFRKPLHVVQTRPEDWEDPTWDLTASIAAIHRTKASHRPFNEEGPLQLLDTGKPRVCAFAKRTRDRREDALVVLNLDRVRAAGIPMPTGPGGAPWTRWTDPCDAVPRVSAPGGELTLAPSGVAVVYGPERPRTVGESDGVP